MIVLSVFYLTFDDFKVFCSNFKISFVNFFCFQTQVEHYFIAKLCCKTFWSIWTFPHFVVWTFANKKNWNSCKFEYFLCFYQTHFGKSLYIYIPCCKNLHICLVGVFLNFYFGFLNLFYYCQCVSIICHRCLFFKNQSENIRQFHTAYALGWAIWHMWH